MGQSQAWGGVNEVSGNWRRQHRTWTQQTCLHIFGCSISNVNRQARNTPSTHTPGTHKHLPAALFVLVLSLVSAADISLSQHSPLALPLPSRTSYQTQILFFFLLLGLCNFPFSFLALLSLFFLFVIAFFILFMLLSLHFTAIALAFKHKNLQQFFVLGLTKICFAKYEG